MGYLKGFRVGLVFLFLVFQLVISAQTVAFAFSAVRHADEDWANAKDRVYKLHGVSTLKRDKWTSVLDEAKPLNKLNIKAVAEWQTEEELAKGFFDVRDFRFLNDPEQMPAFLRRISWLYPDDGCFARAEMMRKILVEIGRPAPNRVFVFGNLKVDTQNSPSGEVTWWYHTAPVVRIKNKIFVLDPAVEPDRPLEISEWAKRQSSTTTSLKFSLCHPMAYFPESNCYSPNSRQIDGAEYDQLNFLSLEWSRQKSLGRDPAEVLGDHPPWSE